MTDDQPAVSDSFTEKLRDRGSSLAPAARRIARFIAENRAVALSLSAAELAARTGSSDATVVRTVQSLGFDGMSHLRRVLASSLGVTEATPADAMRRTLAEAGAEPGRAMDLVIETQQQALEALAARASRDALREAVAVLHPAKRILVFGIGPSAPLAGYIVTLLGRTGRTTRTLDATGIALADQLLDLGAGDALLVLAYGRSYREVAAVFAEARRLSLPLVLVTDSLDRGLAQYADVVVPARRGRSRRVSLHGVTLIALETLALGLAAALGDRAVATLERLNDLRAAIAGGRNDVG
jgi:DNA-binding MurR/RpiR family transcriptional regulator